MTDDSLEQQLRRLGDDWPSNDTFVDSVMSRVDSAPSLATNTDQRRHALMRLSYWTAGAVLVGFVLWWACGPQGTGNVLYAQMKEALKAVQSFHEVTSMCTDDGSVHQAAETWFARGRGFAVMSSERIRIDDGTYFWEYEVGADTASRTKSQSTDQLLDQALDIREELERDCERFPEGDRRIEGVEQQCYRLTFHGAAKPADPSILESDKRRTLIFIDPRSLLKRVESQENVNGEWKTRLVRAWEYDVAVDPRVFEPAFGEQVRVVDIDQAFEQLTAVGNSVHTEVREGLIYTIHQAKRFENGGVMIMSSVRGTEQTLQKFPLTRRRLQPGLYITDGPAVNYEASPQGSGYFRLSLGKANQHGVDAEWWIMVPRSQKPDWFVDDAGRVQLKLGITPHGEYARANHADQQGVIHHITWDLALDVPQPDRLPSLAEIAGQAYADLKLLTGIAPRSLHMGIQEINRVPTQQFASPADVSSGEYAAATREHLLWWERQDVAFQLEHGGVSAGINDGQPVMQPAVFLSYNLAVDDATLAHVAERSDLVAVWVAGTNITDAGLASLKGLKSLERLDVSDTSITDAGLQPLEAMASLRELNVAGTKVTKAGIERLQWALPGLKISTGDQRK